jgi:hypothetical protein
MVKKDRWKRRRKPQSAISPLPDTVILETDQMIEKVYGL